MTAHQLPLPVEARALPASTIARVLEFAAHAESLAGAPPLNDETRIRLNRGDGLVLLAREGSGGAAVIIDGTVEFALPESHDRVAVAQSLAEAAVRSGAGHAWTHGHDEQLERVLQTYGSPDRTLLMLATGTKDFVSPAQASPDTLPSGTTFHTFVPGVDETAWLRLNALVFRNHPEQGAWRLEDLLGREREPWFDPAGFLLAWCEDELVGFIWTKTTSIRSRVSGEIYVIGVSPSAAGQGLGGRLLDAGIAHLRDVRGADEVTLYVEADNERALRLYRHRGFTTRSRDIHWRVEQ